ncbi:MAG: hypothetical protein WC728_08885 [Elusimicrobiota bacterium]
MPLYTLPLILSFITSPSSAGTAQERVEVIADQAEQARGFDLEKANKTIENAFQGQKTPGVKAAPQTETTDDPKKLADKENAAEKARQKGLKTTNIAGGPVVGEDKTGAAGKKEDKGLLSKLKELPLKQMAIGGLLGAITGGFLAMAFGGPMGLMVFGGAALFVGMAFMMNHKP